MTRLLLVVGLGAGVLGTTAELRRATVRVVATPAECGSGQSIPGSAIASVVAVAIRSVVLDPAVDFGGKKKWCSQPKPLFVIAPDVVSIRGCRRIVFVSKPEEALRQANVEGGGADYVKVDIEKGGDDRSIEIVAERGRIVKARDAVQSEIDRKRHAGGNEPTLFREEVIRYRVTASRNRVDVCRYSSLVL